MATKPPRDVKADVAERFWLIAGGAPGVDEFIVVKTRQQDHLADGPS